MVFSFGLCMSAVWTLTREIDGSCPHWQDLQLILVYVVVAPFGKVSVDKEKDAGLKLGEFNQSCVFLKQNARLDHTATRSEWHIIKVKKVVKTFGERTWRMSEKVYFWQKNLKTLPETKCTSWSAQQLALNDAFSETGNGLFGKMAHIQSTGWLCAQRMFWKLREQFQFVKALHSKWIRSRRTIFACMKLTSMRIALAVCNDADFQELQKVTSLKFGMGK